jgi:hypothetical protein
MPASRLLLIPLLAATLLAAEKPADKPGAPPDGQKQVQLSVVISMLRQEAINSWHKDHSWPRQSPNFAWDKKWTLPQDDVLKALSRSLDRNPAIDGYIKWQLLGFQPELGKADTDTINRISANVPKPAKQPQPDLTAAANANGPSGSYMLPMGNYVAGLETKVGNGAVAVHPKVRTTIAGSGLGTGGPSVDMAVVAAAINDELKQQRKLVGQINAAVYTYRDELIRSFPEEGGLKLAMMIKDVRDRVEAGDPDSPAAMKKLLLDAPRLCAEPTLTRDVRNTLINWARLLGAMSTPVAESVSAQGQQLVVKRLAIAIPPDDIKELVTLLNTPAK